MDPGRRHPAARGGREREDRLTRQLLILRHAKSDRDAAVADFDRPLARRGLEEAPRAGGRIAARGWPPDHVVSSPAMRARQTALAVARVLGFAEAAIRFDDRLYLAPRRALLDVLADCPAQAARVLVVGHNPGLEELLEYLADAPPPRDARGRLLTTAALACLETEAPWAEPARGRARLLGLLRPR
jgi:phosphohistidine phosphatase